THTPGVYLQIQNVRTGATVGGWSYGNAQCATCHITYTGNNTVLAGSDVYSVTEGGNMTCNWGGLFWNPATIFFQVEVAYTRVYEPPGQFGTNCSNGAAVASICDFTVGNWCTPGTSPPDMSITKLRYDKYITPAPWGWEVYGLLFRNGVSGPWSGGGNLTQFAFPDSAPQLLALCSYHP